ncbi:hypothetical protein AVEN_228988-1 [Araneus ventricosus]|uniref:Uncharacterized protein n=1 Tax=Araneus ventricosus TaxID=182803 RepID=A0A4Y2I7G7_ARAVE|nr:hypothetical protein AVEN_228988-1 [Araneus ventricosus]
MRGRFQNSPRIASKREANVTKLNHHAWPSFEPQDINLVYLYQHCVLKQRKGYVGTEFVILSLGQMTKRGTRNGTLLFKLQRYTNMGIFDSLRCAKSTDLMWNWISNYYPKAENLPPSRRGL